MRKNGIVFNLISCFLLATILPFSLFSFLSIKKASNVLADNMKLTSLQTLKERQSSCEQYLKNLGQQLNILTRKSELQHLQDEQISEEALLAIEDSIVASLKTTDGSIRGYYATNSGKTLTAWYTVEYGKNVPHHTLKNIDSTNTSWYQSAMSSTYRRGVYAVFSDPYIDPTTNRLIITVSQEVIVDKTPIGSVALDISFDQIKKFIQDIGLLNTGYVLLADAEGNILVDNTRNTVVKSSLSELPNWDEFKNQNQVNTQLTIDGEKVNVLILNDEITNWKLVGIINENEISANLNSIIHYTLIVALVGISFAILIAIIFTIMIKKKLNYMNAAVSDVARGDLSKPIKLIGNDEFTNLAVNFNKMITNVSLLIRDVDSASQALLKSSEEIGVISTETSHATKNVFSAITDVANSTTNQAYRIQEASAHVDNLGVILQETNSFIKDKLSSSTSSDANTTFEDILTRAKSSSNIAITKVENIAADSEEVAAAAEEVSDLTKSVNGSLIKLDEHTEQLKVMSQDLSIALSHFKLNK